MKKHLFDVVAYDVNGKQHKLQYTIMSLPEDEHPNPVINYSKFDSMLYNGIVNVDGADWGAHKTPDGTYCTFKLASFTYKYASISRARYNVGEFIMLEREGHGATFAEIWEIDPMEETVVRLRTIDSNGMPQVRTYDLSRWMVTVVDKAY